MKTMKRALAVLLAAVLLCVGVPLAANAADIVDCGYYGAEGDGTNLYWTLDSDGLLIVSGTGTMFDISNPHFSPFYENQSKIKSVSIGSSVTSIGKNAFYQCQNLTSVTIPDSVTSIGDWAFYGCTALTNVTIPDSVTSIGDYAFYGCENLADADGFVIVRNVLYDFLGSASNVTIPDSVTSIGNSAFNGCSSLMNVTIGNNVTSIGSSAFAYCRSLTSVTIPDSVTSIGDYAFSGCENLADADGFVIVRNVLYDFLGSASNVTIPDSVTSIGNDAFEYCSSLTSVTIPDSVTSIGDWAFYRCTALTNVTIPDSVTSIGCEAFENCTALESVTIGSSVTSIGREAFENCTALESVTMGSSVTSIGILAFANCSSLKSVTIPNSVTSIETAAFSGCSSLTSVTIPDSVTSIENNPFELCNSLTSFSVDENNQNYTSDEKGCLYNKEKTVLIIYPVGNARTSFSIPISVTSIGDHAFFYCSALTNVTIPDSVTSIGFASFSGCSSLTDVYYTGSEARWNAISIDDSNKPLTNATIHYNYQHEHTAGAPVRENEIPATCEMPVIYETVTYCTACGKELSRVTAYDGAPLGHDYGDWYTTTEPTCTEAGEERHDCSRCDSFETQNNASLGHIEHSFTTPSTCAENGFTITICTRCGETLSHEIFPRMEHTWNDGEVTAEPTCTAQGVKTFTCGGCGATYTEPVDLLAHDWDDGVVTKEPSCTEAGEMTYTCATGGETRTEPIDKLDHAIVLVPGKAATCEEPGLTDGWQCETCQKWFAEQQPIEPTGHDMQIQSYVYPTCEEGGYAPFVCSRCGYTEKTDPEPALGHDYQPTYEWSADNSTVTASLICTRCDDVQAKETVGTFQKTVEATCMNPGQVTYTSEGFVNKAFYVQTKTVEIAQKPHVTTQIREVSSTCDKEGVGSYWTCSTCDGIFEDEAATKPLEKPPVLPKLPHTPGEPVTENETAATCTAAGSYDTVVYCFACGAELSRETTATEMIPHTDANNDGSCDTCGAQMQGGDHCKVCGKIHNGGFMDKLTGFFHRIIGLFK